MVNEIKRRILQKRPFRTCNNNYKSIMLLLCISIFFCGCHAKGKVSESTLDSDVNTASNAEDTQTEEIAEEINKDIDSNGIMDAAQIIHREDGSESFIRIFFNGEQIYEYMDDSCRIMGTDVFEYLDLDQDGENEIFIVGETNANSRPLVDVLCLKQTAGLWNPMDMPVNESGNNGFSFKITRGKEEFDFIISSEDMEQEIHFDAAQFFVDDDEDNSNSIQAYRKNHYKEGDEVGFISAWGIWEARAGMYKGRNCIIALEGIEGPYGHSLGEIDIYFGYDETGKVEILNVEYES